MWNLEFVNGKRKICGGLHTVIILVVGVSVVGVCVVGVCGGSGESVFSSKN